MTVSKDRIAPAVRAVLSEAASGKGESPHFLTTYQILARLEGGLRDELIAVYGSPGQGAGKHFTAASRVAQVARDLGGVEIAYMDAKGMNFDQEDSDVRSGYPVIGLYRMNLSGR